MLLSSSKVQRDEIEEYFYCFQAMSKMNRQMKLPQVQKIMMDFERQSEMLDMKTEMMEDAVDDAMEGSDDEEER